LEVQTYIVDDNVVDGDEVCQQVSEPGLMVDMGNTLPLIQEARLR
jgi:hypothetical protein